MVKIIKKKYLYVLTLFILIPFLMADAKNRELKSITVAGITSLYPLEYNNLNSDLSGAYLDLWNLWSKKTGIKVNYVIKSPKSALSGLLNGTVDAVMGYNDFAVRDNKISLTNSIFERKIYAYHNNKIVSVLNFNDLSPYIVGTLSVDSTYILSSKRNVSFIERETVQELFSLSENGRINVFLADSISSNYELYRNGRWKNYIQSPNPIFTVDIKAAVRADRKELLALINSGLSNITDSEKFFVIKTRSGGNVKFNIPWGYITIVSIILFLVAGVILIWVWNVQLKMTVDKTTNELKLMKDEAEASSEAKSHFLDNISHELRTPLTLILGPIENAIKGEELSESMLNMIFRNSKDLLSLINDLLDLSRAQSGKIELNLAKIDLCKLIRLYCASIEPAALSRKVSVSYELPNNSVNVYLDTAQFAKVLANFFSNSIKFTEPGGNINISLINKTSEALICFSDTGCGIPEKEISIVFDRFARVDEFDKNRSNGTGIGLSIVKEITNLHGANVWVKSRHVSLYPDNHGTDFFVNIPKGKGHLQDRDNINFIEEDKTDLMLPVNNYIDIDQTELSESHNIDQSFNNEEKPAVLVVEDNRDMRIFLGKMLSKEYIVYSASDGLEALNILEKSPEIDLVLSDIMMPNLDGHRLLERMRLDDCLIDIPLLFLSARSDEIIKYRGLELGAVDYVLKPFSPDELLLRIKNQIELRVIRNRLMKKNDELYFKLKNKIAINSKKTDLTSTMLEKMEEVCLFIDENFRDDISREIISQAIDINPDSLSRVFRKHTGKNFNDYINELRVEEAKILLAEVDLPITRVSINVGFDNLRTFGRAFKKYTGMSPVEFREKIVHS